MLASRRAFERGCARSLRAVKEAELLARGFRIGSVLSPVARMESRARRGQCHELRRALRAALLRAIRETRAALDRLADRRGGSAAEPGGEGSPAILELQELLACCRVEFAAGLESELADARARLEGERALAWLPRFGAECGGLMRLYRNLDADLTLAATPPAASGGHGSDAPVAVRTAGIVRLSGMAAELEAAVSALASFAAACKQDVRDDGLSQTPTAGERGVAAQLKAAAMIWSQFQLEREAMYPALSAPAARTAPTATSAGAVERGANDGETESSGPAVCDGNEELPHPGGPAVFEQLVCVEQPAASSSKAARLARMAQKRAAQRQREEAEERRQDMFSLQEELGRVLRSRICIC